MLLHPNLLFYYGSSHFTLIVTVIYLFGIMILIWTLTLLVSDIKKAIRKIMKLPPKEKKVFKYRKHIHFIAWPVFTVVACLYIYAIYYGFVEFDEPSPARRFYYTLDDLQEACKGRFLFPPYIPDALNPEYNKFSQFGSTLYASRYSAIGSYTMGYSISYELVEKLLSENNDGYLILGYGANTSSFKLRDGDLIKEIEINEMRAVFRYTEIYNSYYDINSKNIRLQFIGSRRASFGNYVSMFRNAKSWYYLGFSYVCDDPGVEKEVIEYLENELIKLAEAMLEQGLPRRF